MDIELLYGPGNAAAQITLAPMDSLTAEAGSMIAMSSNLTLETTTHKRGKRGLLSAAKRLLAGESFFLNHYTAPTEGGDVLLAATLPGDMMRYDLDQENLIVQSGSFVACESSVSIDLGWQGFKSLLSGESVFWLHLSGTGPVVLSSFGAIYAVDVDREYIVDSGHIVAFNETLNFEITKAGKSWIGSFLGGEGFVCKFVGQGRVWCQSHNPPGFGRILGPKLKPRH